MQAESQPPAADQTQAAAPAPKARSFHHRRGERFHLQSADTNFTLQLQGMGQLDSHYYASPNPGAKDTFTMRRLRAVASGTVYKDYDYYMQTDFGSGFCATTTNDNLLLDAYVNIHYCAGGSKSKAGKMRDPVGLEIQPADENLYLVERGYPSELVPNRDVGFMVHGDLFNGALLLRHGAFNGVPTATAATSKRATTARMWRRGFLRCRSPTRRVAGLKNFGLGLGASYGFEVGATTCQFFHHGPAEILQLCQRRGHRRFAERHGSGRSSPAGTRKASIIWGPAGLLLGIRRIRRKSSNAMPAPHTPRSGFDNRPGMSPPPGI